MACTYRHLLIKYVIFLGSNIANTSTSLFQSKVQHCGALMFSLLLDWHKLLKSKKKVKKIKQSSCLWSAMPWCSCEVTVMRDNKPFHQSNPMMTPSNEKISALLVLYEGNPLVTGGFPSQRPVTRSFHVNKWLNKQSRHRWFEMPSHSLWHHK